jgi:hypothetical protein
MASHHKSGIKVVHGPSMNARVRVSCLGSSRLEDADEETGNFLRSRGFFFHLLHETF